MTEASTHYHAIHPAIAVSFEFFPGPKTAAMEASLWNAIRKLEPLAPDFVSVTFRAAEIHTRTDACDDIPPPEGNLTETRCTLDLRRGGERGGRQYHSRIGGGVRHIVALRGDPPEGAGAAYVPHPAATVTAPT